MKTSWLFFLTLWMLPAFGQTTTSMSFSIDTTYQRDSIRLDNTVKFVSLQDGTELVQFHIKVTNLGHQSIPNFACVTARSAFLKLLVNGEDVHDLNIMNGIGPTQVQWLDQGDSDVFTTAWELTDDAGVFAYRNPMSIQWRYLELLSSVVVVDLVEREIVE